MAGDVTGAVTGGGVTGGGVTGGGVTGAVTGGGVTGGGVTAAVTGGGVTARAADAEAIACSDAAATSGSATVCDVVIGTLDGDVITIPCESTILLRS